ncbi:MAG TPA: flagellar FliJ family protein [Candidatus Hydrogenedentes bacterium]|nr:flagellar FliJ family protein [Candidatus Hydrogenedentota bacterium]HOS02012.1 flagellar FliJ family protein [Candidatus Hydrogenedentota bacterium]
MAAGKPHRFDTLVRVRSLQENQQAQALASVRRHIATVERQRKAIQQEQQRVLREAGDRSRRVFDAMDVRRYYEYERYLARLAVEKDASLQELRRVEEDRRLELDKAIKRRRMVERMQERDAMAWAQQRQRDEQKRTDEAAVGQAAQRRERGAS